ncbi:MAG: lipid-binding SYLF domain-containing protein [Planctomycetota bacterium]|jgi:lipid-binding SYLF domain-containing protein
MRDFTVALMGCVLTALLLPNLARAQAAEEETIQAAMQVVREVMAVPLRAIPASLLREAQGVAIIPGKIRAGFIIGVAHGRGVVLTRDKDGAWQSPNFITATGGGIGWQAGVQSTDVILVFRTRASVANLMRGKFTIGADASVAAGPVGRQASAATDATLRAEILSYSRSRGLFAGVSLDGAVIQIDNRANVAFYGLRQGQPTREFPQSALNLIMQIAAYANPAGANGPPNERETVRRQLAEASQQLQAILDPQWQQFLSLPAEVSEGTQIPTAESLAPARARFQTVANDPQFRTLTDRHEFQETFGFLNHFIQAAAAPGQLNLPPPPKQ